MAEDVEGWPDLAEDRNGIQDVDGCPEDDGDGFLDHPDARPLYPGDRSSDLRTHGCPPSGKASPDATTPASSSTEGRP